MMSRDANGVDLGTMKENAGVVSSGRPPSESERSGKGAHVENKRSLSPELRSGNFLVYKYKIVPCSTRRVHDWSACPFAHTGERARRRDHMICKYSGIVCSNMKSVGTCYRGDKCAYAHSVFEYWLHPTRFRTQLCSDGAACIRQVCFFAHSSEELRVAPDKRATGASSAQGQGQLEDESFAPATQSAPSTAASVAPVTLAEASDQADTLRIREPASSTPTVKDRVVQQVQPNGPMQDTAAQSARAICMENLRKAISGEKTDDVVNMLSDLLTEASLEKRDEEQDRTVGATQPDHDKDFVKAIRALDSSEGQALLADSVWSGGSVSAGLSGSAFLHSGSQQWTGNNTTPPGLQSEPLQHSMQLLQAPARVHSGEAGRPAFVPLPSQVWQVDTVGNLGIQEAGSQTSRLPANPDALRRISYRYDGMHPTEPSGPLLSGVGWGPSSLSSRLEMDWRLDHSLPPLNTPFPGGATNPYLATASPNNTDISARSSWTDHPLLAAPLNLPAGPSDFVAEHAAAYDLPVLHSAPCTSRLAYIRQKELPQRLPPLDSSNYSASVNRYARS